MAREVAKEIYINPFREAARQARESLPHLFARVARKTMNEFHGRETTGGNSVVGEERRYPIGTVIEQTEELCKMCAGTGNVREATPMTTSASYGVCPACQGSKYIITKRVTRMTV